MQKTTEPESVNGIEPATALPAVHRATPAAVESNQLILKKDRIEISIPVTLLLASHLNTYHLSYSLAEYLNNEFPLTYSYNILLTHLRVNFKFLNFLKQQKQPVIDTQENAKHPRES